MFLAGVMLRIVLLAGVSAGTYSPGAINKLTSATKRGRKELLLLLYFVKYGYVLLTAFHYMYAGCCQSDRKVKVIRSDLAAVCLG